MTSTFCRLSRHGSRKVFKVDSPKPQVCFRTHTSSFGLRLENGAGRPVEVSVPTPKLTILHVYQGPLPKTNLTEEYLCTSTRDKTTSSLCTTDPISTEGKISLLNISVRVQETPRSHHPSTTGTSMQPRLSSRGTTLPLKFHFFV